MTSPSLTKGQKIIFITFLFEPLFFLGFTLFLHFSEIFPEKSLLDESLRGIITFQNGVLFSLIITVIPYLVIKKLSFSQVPEEGRVFWKNIVLLGTIFTPCVVGFLLSLLVGFEFLNLLFFGIPFLLMIAITPWDLIKKDSRPDAPKKEGLFDKCPGCGGPCSMDAQYQCENCGEAFWQSQEAFEKKRSSLE